MAYSDHQNTTFDPVVLNSNEQNLLLNALNSNNPSNQTVTTGRKETMNATQEFASPIDQTPGSGNMYDSTPFLDYDVDDSNFDWDLNDQLIGDLPGEQDGDEEDEGREKRKNTDDEDGGGKRRESEGGQKKPGRKPLTNEPTSKRKAQNRAAQRAFRERKEKHLKDLELKVEDLEKASEAANHENGLLRAQVERLQTELREYRKRLSVNTTQTRSSPTTTTNGPSLSSKTSWDINNNFQFAFPKFGFTSDKSAAATRDSSTSSFNPQQSASRMANGQATSNKPSPAGLTAANMADLSNLFSPSILASANSNSDADYMNFNGAAQPNGITQSPAAGSMHSKKSTEHAGSEANTNSPTSSANNGFTSSCVTTPEYQAESPGQRKAGEAAFNSISVEERRRKSNSHDVFVKDFSKACGNKINPVPPMLADSETAPASSATTALQPHTPSLDSQNFDWFASQNGGGVFDPVLFGDYRDPQESIMNADFGAFFNDAFPLTTETNEAVQTLEPALPKKRDLMREIEQNEGGNEPEVVPGENPKQFLTCNMLWDRVQRSAKVQSGEADMDDLCSQLKAKAKCSGQGAVIEQRDVDAILGPAPDDTKDFFKMFK